MPSHRNSKPRWDSIFPDDRTAHLNCSRPRAGSCGRGGAPRLTQQVLLTTSRVPWPPLAGPLPPFFRDAGPLYRGSCPMPETAGKCLAQGVFRAFNGHFQGKGTHRCGCVRPPPRSVQPSRNTRPPAARPPFSTFAENGSVPCRAPFSSVPFSPEHPASPLFPPFCSRF